MKCLFLSQKNSRSLSCQTHFLWEKKTPPETNYWWHLTPRTFISSSLENLQLLTPTVFCFSIPPPIDGEQEFSPHISKDKYKMWGGEQAVPWGNKKGAGIAENLSTIKKIFTCWALFPSLFRKLQPWAHIGPCKEKNFLQNMDCFKSNKKNKSVFPVMSNLEF